MRLNPHGRVPTLVYDGENVMYEAAAICLFLCERHPEAGLRRHRGIRIAGCSCNGWRTKPTPCRKR